MSGNYPDGVTQSSFDEYWNDKLDDPPETSNEELIDYWQENSSLCMEVFRDERKTERES